MPLVSHSGRELTPEQAACYIAAALVLAELKSRGGPMAHEHPLTPEEIALRAALDYLRHELMHRAGEPGYAITGGGATPGTPREET